MRAFLGNDFGHHDGYIGAFSRQSAPGAIPAGTRIKKAWSEPGDTHPVGAEGVVLGSIYQLDHGYAYFVEWDDAPRLAVACVAKKIAAAETTH
jgi:hypothetical protein